MLGDRSDPCRDEDGITAAGQPPRAERFAPSGLGLQAVIDGEEIQQPTLGDGRQAGPVPPGQH